MKQIKQPYYFYEGYSKHLGFAVLNKNEIAQFKNDFKEIDFNEVNHKIKGKYFFASSLNDVFMQLIIKEPNFFNFQIFDKIFLDKE